MANTIEKWANNARTTLAGSLSNVATSIVLQSGAGALFPSPNNLIGEFAKATLQDAATGLRNEIVYITARTGDVLTAIRGQDGTTAQTWSAGDTVFEGVTAGTLANFVQPAYVQSGQYVYAEASGATTAYTANLTPAPAVLTEGMQVVIDTNTVGTNTTTTPTFNLNGLAACTITLNGGTALRVGDLPRFAALMYNATATKWELLNPQLINYAVPVGTAFPYTGGGSAPQGYIFDNGAALSRTAYPDLFALWVTNAGFTSQTFTVTIASPAVFTKASHGLNDGDRLRLSTTGALPTGLNTSTDYFVEKIDANTFYLSVSIFGVATRITTTGTQSGTHSYLQSLYGLGDGSTTFNAPDGRGYYYRSKDASGKTVGSHLKGTLSVWDTQNAGSVPTVISAQENYATSLAIALSTMGADSIATTDYWTLGTSYNSTVTQGTLASLAGGVGGACGATRPNSIVTQYIIKY